MAKRKMTPQPTSPADTTLNRRQTQRRRGTQLQYKILCASLQESRRFLHGTGEGENKKLVAEYTIDVSTQLQHPNHKVTEVLWFLDEHNEPEAQYTNKSLVASIEQGGLPVVIRAKVTDSAGDFVYVQGNLTFEGSELPVLKIHADRFQNKAKFFGPDPMRYKEEIEIDSEAYYDIEQFTEEVNTFSFPENDKKGIQFVIYPY